jgi:hypothetical protein
MPRGLASLGVRDLPGTFGYLIAFIAPGSLVLWGAAQSSTELRRLLSTASIQETSFGAFLVALTAAVSLGVVVSGLRALLYEGWLLKGRIEPFDKRFSYGVVARDPAGLDALKQLHEDFYRYFQFYSNMAVATLTTYVLWAIAQPSGTQLAKLSCPFVVVLPVLLVLHLSATESMSRFLLKRDQLASRKE